MEPLLANFIVYWTIYLCLLQCVLKNGDLTNLGRYFNKSPRTGQRILRKIRNHLPDHFDQNKLQGVCEFDETKIKGIWIGGAKARGGRLKLIPLISRSIISINRWIYKTLDHQAIVFTDEWRGYNDVHITHSHYTVRHSKEFVSSYHKAIHTNSIESVWGYAKPLLSHTYRGTPELKGFLNEICFKHNFCHNERRSFLTALSFRLRKHQH
jgi:hypothetical protein